MIRMTRLRLAVATLTHAPARRRSKVERVVPRHAVVIRRRLNALTEAMRPPAARYMLAPAATLFVIGPSRTGIFRRSRSTPKAENSRVASRDPASPAFAQATARQANHFSPFNHFTESAEDTAWAAALASAEAGSASAWVLLLPSR